MKTIKTTLAISAVYWTVGIARCADAGIAGGGIVNVTPGGGGYVGEIFTFQTGWYVQPDYPGEYIALDGSLSLNYGPTSMQFSQSVASGTAPPGAPPLPSTPNQVKQLAVFTSTGSFSPSGGGTVRLVDCIAPNNCTTGSTPSALVAPDMQIGPSPYTNTPTNPNSGTTLPSSCLEFPSQCGIDQILKPRFVGPHNGDGGLGVRGWLPPNGGLGIASEYYIDAGPGDAYSFSTGGAPFETVSLPSDAPGSFTLETFDGAPDQMLDPGETLAFATPVDDFALVGDPPGLVLGVSFATTDPAAIGDIWGASYTANAVVDVDEPGSLALLGASLAGSVALRRRYLRGSPMSRRLGSPVSVARAYHQHTGSGLSPFCKTPQALEAL
jgi:hypothetical protein